MEYDRCDNFKLLNQMEFNLVHSRKENFDNEHIPVSLKEIEITFSECT